jgi:glycosyltransferase involved in cell wall biosynthesis
MSEPLIKRLRYRLAQILRKVAGRVYPKGSALRSGIFSDIGLSKLGPSAPRALIIYNTAGVERYVYGQFDEHGQFSNKHTMYWESVEMVKILNARGYVVDYADYRIPYTGPWEKYSLVIDQMDNLKNAPTRPGLAKIQYATYIHWLVWNRAELERIAWFKKRTGITIPMNRQIPPIVSDEYADYITYFGTPYQADSFDKKPKRHQLNISAVYEPPHKPKNISESRHNFIWLGGGGLVHKGLDIAMEAFAKVPEAHLYIAGDLKSESRFWKWAEPFLAKHQNIHMLGWMDVGGQAFDDIARRSIGIVYPSGAEGGPGSVAQALHWGLIPIVTKSALVRAETLGYIIQGSTDNEFIDSAAALVRTVMNTPEEKLREQSDAVVAFAQKYHTRKAYSESFSRLIDTISKS